MHAYLGMRQWAREMRDEPPVLTGRTLSVEYVSKEPGGYGAEGGSVDRARSRSPYGRRRSRSPSYGGAARSRSPVRSPRCVPPRQRSLWEDVAGCKGALVYYKRK